MWLLFIFVLSSFLPTHNFKLYGRCEYCTYQITALLLGMCLFWFGVAYELWLASYSVETVSNCLQKHITFSFVDFWGFSSHILGVECIVRSHTDYWMRALKEPTVSKQKFNYSFLYLLGLRKPTLCTRRRRCASRYHLDLRRVIAPIFRRKYLWLSIILT